MSHGTEWPSIVPNQGAQGLPGAFQHDRVAVSDQHPDRAVATPFSERPHANELLGLIGHLDGRPVARLE